jgi:hypothetical protein
VNDRPPHEVLDVSPDAPDSVVRGAARQLLADLKPNGEGGDREAFVSVRKARDAMLEE